MTPEDLNRFKAKAETLAESFCMWVIGLPAPLTAIVVLIALASVSLVTLKFIGRVFA